MNTYEALNRLLGIANELFTLYRELSNDLPKIHFVDDDDERRETVTPFPAVRPAPSDEEHTQEVQKRKSSKKELANDEAISIPTIKEKKKLLTVSQFKKRKRKNSYEARCMYYGKCISISAKNTATLKERLRAYVEEFNKLNQPTLFPSAQPTTPALAVVPEEKKTILFKDFAFEYLEVMKKDDVKDSWYSRQETRLRRHILPLLGERPLAEISGFECKKVLETIRKKELFRTAEEVHSTLKQIFEFAQADGVTAKNPMARIKFVKAERDHGRCLSFVEEVYLLSLAKGTRYEYHVILMLYAGLRPCECNSAYVEGNFIVARNMKRKNGKVEWKRIPITPMMKKYLPFLTSHRIELPSYALQNWFYKMKDWDIKAYYCRHTFNTRLGKFKIDLELRKLAMGHKSSEVNIDTYMHYSEIADTFYTEFQKVDYSEELNRAQNMPKILPPRPPKKPKK